MMIIVYILFTVLFWNMCNIAAQEGRVGWAWVYLFMSALNGSMAIAAVFQEKCMKEAIVAAVVFLLFFGMMFFAMLYQSTMTQQCKEMAMQTGFDAIQIQAICGK